MKKLLIINMYQNNILHKDYKNKLRKNTVISSVVFCVLLFCCSYVKIVGGSSVNEWYTEVSSVYNPITKLYNEEDNMIFTNNDNIIISNGVFVLPLFSSKVDIVNNQIEIMPIENIMVVAPCAGIIEEIGKTSEGKKFIKIKHSTKITSVIEGLETFGVEKGNVVKQDETIATAGCKNKIVFTVFKNGKNVENLRIDKNHVLWD